MNNIFSEQKYRDRPEGVSLMDETNNQLSHPGLSPLIHDYGYGSVGYRPACLASSLLKFKSFIQYAG